MPSSRIPPLADDVHVLPWPDPVIDRLGHDPRSLYVERFWLPVLGPSTTLLLRRLAGRLEATPEGFTLQLAEAADELGVGNRPGRGGPFQRAIERCCQYGMATRCTPGELAVRRRLPPVNHHQVQRLPRHLRAAHDAFLAAPRAGDPPEQQRRRAGELAARLFEIGESEEVVARQLHDCLLHPAVAHEALVWGREHVGRSEDPPASDVA